MYAIDLKPFYENTSIKCLLQDSIVEMNGRQYRADRWFKSGKHCFVFIDITMDSEFLKKPFAKTPTYIKELIEENKLKIIKLI